MGKRSKSDNTASEPGSLLVEGKRVKNKKNKSDCGDANNESKTEEAIITSEDKQVKKRKKNKLQPTEVGFDKKNKKIIFNDEDDAVEVDNPPIQRNRRNQDESPQENEEDIKDEDIDKFCDELNDEDNEQYENWVKLIEAKLNSNNKKPK